MDETQLGAWQVALVEALSTASSPADVREALRAAVPWAEATIAALDDRSIATAIDLVRRWSPMPGVRERG